MRKLFQNKVTIILLIIALVVLLAACNQNQGASEQAGEQIKDASEWKKQEIILKNGVPYAMDEQGDSTKLGEAIQPPDEWKDQDLGGRNDACISDRWMACFDVYQGRYLCLQKCRWREHLGRNQHP